MYVYICIAVPWLWGLSANFSASIPGEYMQQMLWTICSVACVSGHVTVCCVFEGTWVVQSVAGLTRPDHGFQCVFSGREGKHSDGKQGQGMSGVFIGFFFCFVFLVCGIWWCDWHGVCHGLVVVLV